MIDVRVALQGGDALGEGPVWRPSTGELLRVDIEGGAVHAWDPQTGAVETTCFEGEVGAVIPRRGGSIVAAVELDLVAVQRDGGRCALASATGLEPAENRFNDCRCDPAGRLWAGTLSKRRETGAAALYRLDPGPTLTRVLAGTTVSNGIGWSPDATRMYFIDTPTLRVDVFDYDVSTGTLASRRPFAAVDPAAGKPDGLTVDAEGGVWVALFGGGAVRRYDAEGALDAVVELPVPHPTCPAFGGPDLATLFITTSRHKLSPAEHRQLPLAGAVLACEPGVRGLAAAELAG